MRTMCGNKMSNYKFKSWVDSYDWWVVHDGWEEEYLNEISRIAHFIGQSMLYSFYSNYIINDIFYNWLLIKTLEETYKKYNDC